MEYYSAIRKYEILPFVTIWMDIENIMLSEISQAEKFKNLMTSLLMWNIKLKATNEQSKQTKTYRYRQQYGGTRGNDVRVSITG